MPVPNTPKERDAAAAQNAAATAPKTPKPATPAPKPAAEASTPKQSAAPLTDQQTLSGGRGNTPPSQKQAHGKLPLAEILVVFSIICITYVLISGALYFIVLKHIAFGFSVALFVLGLGLLVNFFWPLFLITVGEDVRVRLINRLSGETRLVKSGFQLKSPFEEYNLEQNEVKLNPIQVKEGGVVELRDDSFVNAKWVIRLMPGGANGDLSEEFDILGLTLPERTRILTEEVNILAVRVARAVAQTVESVGEIRASGQVEKEFEAVFTSVYGDAIKKLGCTIESAQLTFDIDSVTQKTLQQRFKAGQTRDEVKKMVKDSEKSGSETVLTEKQAYDILLAQDPDANASMNIISNSGSGAGLTVMDIIAALKGGGAKNG